MLVEDAGWTCEAASLADLSRSLSRSFLLLGAKGHEIAWRGAGAPPYAGNRRA